MSIYIIPSGTSKLASSSLNQSSASTTELISDKTTSFGDEKSAKSSSFFYATSSTPSLSELNTSTTFLCRSGEKKRGARHFSADVLPLLKKQASGTHSALVTGSTSTAAAAAATAAGRACTVYYDALAEHLLEDNNSDAVQQQIDVDNAKCVLNPVFCTEEEEEEKRWTKTKLEHFDDQTEGDEDVNCCDNTGGGAGSLESLIKETKRSTANNELAAEKPHQHQPHSPSSPPALLLSSSKSSSNSSGNIRKRQPSSREQKQQQHQQQKQRGGPMRILGSSGSGSGDGGGGMVSKAKASGTGGTSVAPMSMSISDGPAAPSSTAAVEVATGGGKRVIQAKHNQMYLITTLLPGHGQSHQNGNAQNGVHHHHHSQTNGHRRNNSPHMPSAALINRILPTELMLRVFSYLDITSLGRCAQVCRSWNKLAMDGSNWMDVDLFSFQREVKTTVVESLAKRCGSFLKVLSLKGCENVQDNAMRSFAAKCPNIEQLTLTKCKLVTDSTCEYIGRYCHRIVMIDLENCTLITDIALKFIGEGCKRLEEINLSWCEQISDIGIAYVAKSCPNLHTLFCKGLDNLSSQCFGQLVMPELRALNLFSCPNVTDETVADVARNCHQLEFLSLSNCKEITDQAIVSISHGCPKLRDLELAGCANLTDSGFVQLAKNCHELERMDLEECLLITDSTLSNFNNGCPNLYSLSLSHCENLTDNGLADLCVAHRERLQVLELDNCPNITDLALESMKHLKVLERVDLYDCQMITKDAIKKFKQARPEVEVHAYFAPATPPPQPAPSACSSRLQPNTTALRWPWSGPKWAIAQHAQLRTKSSLLRQRPLSLWQSTSGQMPRTHLFDAFAATAHAYYRWKQAAQRGDSVRTLCKSRDGGKRRRRATNTRSTA
uniref:F-box domain-containing protein n=1 Tax=Globodera rostochiensis TaxID=31243 RepID=A0A914HZX8_GLORO